MRQAQGNRMRSHLEQPAGAETVSRDVWVPAGRVALHGTLSVPLSPRGLVIFAHGSGSSRSSPRNVYVGACLNGAGLATFLLDLLTDEEALRRSNVFDVPLLAERLTAAARRLELEPDLASLETGYFGASTGAAAALWSASDDPSIGAIVSRGGRPDLAEPRLADVRVPTLLIVGSRDPVVLGLNRLAASRLAGPTELRVVEGATHLFEEPGALDAVAALAAGWFARHLGRSRVRASSELGRPSAT